MFSGDKSQLDFRVSSTNLDLEMCMLSVAWSFGCLDAFHTPGFPSIGQIPPSTLACTAWDYPFESAASSSLSTKHSQLVCAPLEVTRHGHKIEGVSTPLAGWVWSQ